MTKHARFPSPYDLPPPSGAEDWKGLYPYYLTFKDKLRGEEDAKFWFCDAQHWPSPFKPFDAITVEFAVKCLGQYNTRHYMVPPANGVERSPSTHRARPRARSPCAVTMAAMAAVNGSAQGVPSATARWRAPTSTAVNGSAGLSPPRPAWRCAAPPPRSPRQSRA